jgi:predicted RNase H-like HicB family nuclease
MTHNVVVRAEFFREGELFVGLAPELNVSSFGETLEEAKGSLREAVDSFLEECAAMGTLEEVLEEAGFGQKQGIWLPRQPVAAELLTVG